MDALLVPYLIHRPFPDEPATHIAVDKLPFVIGRSRDAHLTIHSRRVSKRHASIAERRGGYVVEDLDSHNGTFLNGARVEREAPLANGDVLHIGTTELRFAFAAYLDDDSIDGTMHTPPERQVRALHGSRDLADILVQRAITPVYQPIVHMSNRAIYGYEALSRVSLPSIDCPLPTLFAVAAEQDRAVELSRMMRQISLERAVELPRQPMRLFLNIHPAEMAPNELMESLREVADKLGDWQRGVVEVHESVITDPAAMLELRGKLHGIGLELAYDDFGAGHSRLRELAEAPPDVVKLDQSLIRNIELSAPRQDLVSALIRIMLDQGVSIVAEGIETEEEWAVCADLGCQLAQGFLVQKPTAIEDM